MEDNKPSRNPRKSSQLLEIIGTKSKFKILMDESISYFPREDRVKEIVWCEYIPAYKGLIYLSCVSPIELAFFSESIQKINTIKKELGDLVKAILMDGEGVIYFKPQDFKKIAKLAGAKTGRTISEEHKQKLLESRKKENK